MQQKKKKKLSRETKYLILSFQNVLNIDSIDSTENLDKYDVICLLNLLQTTDSRANKIIIISKKRSGILT